MASDLETSPTVSVGVPVYNGERFLRETLDSLLGQTHRDFELILSDNASTDSTAAICEDYAHRDPRIRFSRLDANRGAAFNYNRVFHLSRGRYFKWHAADDLCAPDVLEKCLESLESRPSAVLSYPGTQIIDESSRVVGDYDDGLDVRLERPEERFRAVLRRRRECNAVFGLVRSSCLRRTALIQPYMGSDAVLLGELSLYGEFVQRPDTTFFRRDHAAASSRNTSLAEQLEFFDPSVSQEIFLRRWRHNWEYLKGVGRSSLGALDKARCGWVLLRRVVASRDEMARELLGAGRHLWSRRLEER